MVGVNAETGAMVVNLEKKQMIATHSVCLFPTGRPFGCRRPVVERRRPQSGRLVTGEVKPEIMPKLPS